jgi:ABC-type protease/lipase transport system fused ATPase/permease subunit
MLGLSKILTRITSSRRAVALTAFAILLAVGIAKFAIVVCLLQLGVPRAVLQAQDAVITGGLSATLVWLLLVAVRARRNQQVEQIQVVADLNHNLRNALEVILSSEYLRQSNHATAIRESVERIDTTLSTLLPAAKTLK